MARWVCASLLLYAAGNQILVELKKLQDKELTLAWPLLCIGAAWYAAAMTCFGAYWRQTAQGMGGQLSRLETQRAYFASQLGKYIPGKAWVILIRCLIVDKRTTTAPVVIASTFYETLAMMAAGSLMAFVALLSTGKARPIMLALSLGLAACLLPAVLPPVFGRLTIWTAKRFRKGDALPIASVSYATWLQGFRYCIPGWVMVGLSLLATASSLGISMMSWEGFLTALGSIALAIVGGFAVLIVPGGLGVREWVLMETLGQSIGTGNAVLVAILTRITHVSVELFVAGCLYLIRNQGLQDD